jgi:hypothetical protein
MNNEAILSTVQILERIFAIVLALALGEAFKQFVSDTPKNPDDSFIHWDRFTALAALLLLLIPFYQGMGQYFYQVYHTAQRPKPYSAFLLVDCVAFTLEAALFFVMSRALPMIQWRRFYKTVLLVLILDTLWGSFVWVSHHQAIQWWLVLNILFMAVFVVILSVFRPHNSKWGPRLALLAMIVRTVADYRTSWEFYFPS